jgi:hypothetical protein
MHCEKIDIEFDDVTVFFFGVAVVLTLLFLFIASRTETSKPLVLPEMDLFDAHDATSTANDILPELSQRATFYGASWCGFTQKQFDELGVTATDLKGLNYVECEDEPERCAQDGIDAFPTWIIDGQLFSGYQDTAKLKALLQN